MSRGALDPEFCYPTGSRSMPDPDMSDPDPNQILVTWIWPDLDPAGSGSKPRLLPTTGEKLLFLHHNWKS